MSLGLAIYLAFLAVGLTLLIRLTIKAEEGRIVFRIKSSSSSVGHRTLWDDIRGGWLYATGFSVIALVIIGVAALSSATGGTQVTGWDTLPLGLPLVVLGYFAAGTLGGMAFGILRPLRRWLLGWMLTGFVIAALVYGAVCMMGVVGYYLGFNILDLNSGAEGWRLLPGISLITGIFPGSLLGAYYWYKNRKRE
jgi:hypothetical protein